MNNTGRTKLAELKTEAPDAFRATVVGRIMALSQATFTLEDQTERRTFHYSGEENGKGRLRVGDIVQVEVVFSSGCWRMENFTVLAPCMLDGARLEHWLKLWNRHSDGKRRRLETRARAIKLIRNFFEHLGFLEVETPSLVKCAGMEPHLFGFESDWVGPDNSFTRHYHMPTSPEFHMKQLLMLGYEKIFQLARSYRNREYSPTHQPEFIMLEWYRAYAPYEKLMDDMEHLAYFLQKEINGSPVLKYHGCEIDLTPPWNRISVKEIFQKKLNIDLSIVQNGADLVQQASAAGYRYLNGDENFEDAFFKLFLTEIELKLGWDKPCILYDYPFEMAALSRRKPGDKRFCERFEAYIAGIELANAFGELNNAREQRKRFEEMAREKKAIYGYEYAPDPDFLEGLEFGMPPSSGIALGVERLIMLILGEKSINELIAFPHMSPLEEELED